MNLTDEAVALLIDPKRERGEWWNAGMFCKACQGDWLKCGCTDLPVETLFYIGPHLTTDRVAAFTWVTPILLAAGWFITEHEDETWGQDHAGVTQASESTYPAATTAALAWLAEHEPERLRKAVEETRHD